MSLGHTEAVRVADLHDWAHDPANPEDEWAPVTKPVLRAIEAAAREAERAHMRAMRIDWRTMPHAQFPVKWPDWREYEEVLPTRCDCRECTLWRSGS